MAPIENKFDEVAAMMKDWNDEEVITFMNNVFRAHGLSVVPHISVQVQKISKQTDDFEKHVQESTKQNS